MPCAPQQEKPLRGEAHDSMKSSPYLLQLEKRPGRQSTPSTAENKYVNKMKLFFKIQPFKEETLYHKHD